jgi:hypothetical protein
MASLKKKCEVLKQHWIFHDFPFNVTFSCSDKTYCGHPCGKSLETTIHWTQVEEGLVSLEDQREVDPQRETNWKETLIVSTLVFVACEYHIRRLYVYIYIH